MQIEVPIYGNTEAFPSFPILHFPFSTAPSVLRKKERPAMGKKNKGGCGGGAGPARAGIAGYADSTGGAVTSNDENETVSCTDQPPICTDPPAIENACTNDGAGREGNEGGGVEKKGGGRGGGSVTAVLKVDFHCDGCTERIRHSIKGFKGVEGVKVERESSKLTVVGTMNPQELLERIHKKTKKKLELIIPNPKKENKKQNCSDQPKEETKKDQKDNKQVLMVSTAVLKISLHCEGCIRRIHDTILKIAGVEQVTIDTKKCHVTIKGTMKTKGLAEFISHKVKKPVEVINPKKEKEKDQNEKKNNKEKKCGQDDATFHAADVAASGWYDECGYQVQMVYPPQLFSDENPNACYVM